MLFAQKTVSELQTAVRQLDERTKTIQRDIDLLRDSTDSATVNLRSEWRQVLAELEDTLDKVQHQAQRLQKRKQRAEIPKEDPTEGAEGAEDATEDPVTERVKQRRGGHAIRS